MNIPLHLLRKMVMRSSSRCCQHRSQISADQEVIYYHLKSSVLSICNCVPKYTLREKHSYGTQTAWLRFIPYSKLQMYCTAESNVYLTSGSSTAQIWAYFLSRISRSDYLVSSSSSLDSQLFWDFLHTPTMMHEKTRRTSAIDPFETSLKSSSREKKMKQNIAFFWASGIESSSEGSTTWTDTQRNLPFLPNRHRITPLPTIHA